MKPKSERNHSPMEITDDFDSTFYCVEPLRRAFKGSLSAEKMKWLLFVAANDNKSLAEVASYLDIPPNILQALASSEAGTCFVGCARSNFQVWGIPSIYVLFDELESK